MSPYSGKILWVNLTTQTFTEEIIPNDIYAQYLGGMGLAAWVLYQHIPAITDPLGPDNILGFLPGLLTGTPTLYTGRWMAVGKSPLTGTWGEANCGGFFSMAIKQCGYDGIFFKGISQEPVYLYIGNDEPQLLSATDLWGQDTCVTEDILIARHRERKTPSVACIGEAGEKISLIAGISHDHGRMAARSGLGAVMGIKNLKAVVLQGSRRSKIADFQTMKKLSQKTQKFAAITLPFPNWIAPWFGRILRNRWIGIRLDGIISNTVIKKWGSSGYNQCFNEWDDSPVKNWLGSHRDFPVKRSNAFAIKQIMQDEQEKYHCLACPTGCGGSFSREKYPSHTHKPEYETFQSFGGLLLNDDYQSVVKINDLLNRAGMDSISAGAVIAAAIEWYTRGLINSSQTGGLELAWGKAEAILEIVHQMITRTGFGASLADGIKLATEKLRVTDPDSCIHAGGQELGMHDPRLDPGFAVHASVEPNPGRHTTGSNLFYDMHRLWKVIPELPHVPVLTWKKRTYTPNYEHGLSCAATSIFVNFYNCLGVCFYGAFLGADRLLYFDQVNAACGWDRSPQDYMQIGQRVQTLKQLFNLKQGIDPASIRPSRRTLGLPPLKAGGNRGVRLDLDSMRRFYWQAIGWDHDFGIPTPETVSQLGLQALAEELELPALILSKGVPVLMGDMEKSSVAPVTRVEEKS
jgi:aldehyde:ferredoxin oxidoreductase